MEAETAILRKKTKINAGIKKKKKTLSQNLRMPLVGLLVYWAQFREESLSQKDISIESLKTKKQREQRLRKNNIISKDCGTTTKGIHMCNGNARIKRNRRNIFNSND